MNSNVAMQNFRARTPKKQEAPKTAIERQEEIIKNRVKLLERASDLDHDKYRDCLSQGISPETVTYLTPGIRGSAHPYINKIYSQIDTAAGAIRELEKSPEDIMIGNLDKKRSGCHHAIQTAQDKADSAANAAANLFCFAKMNGDHKSKAKEVLYKEELKKNHVPEMQANYIEMGEQIKQLKSQKADKASGTSEDDCSAC